MQHVLIPGLDFLNLSDKQEENSNSSDSQSVVINLPLFNDSFRLPLSNSNCRPLEEFQKEKSMRDEIPEHFYQCKDLVKKKNVTLVRYKKIKSLDEELKDLLHEIEIVRNLKHYNILQYHETVASQLTNVYLVYDTCACFLFDLIENKVEKLYQLSVIKNIMLQLLEALNYIHEHSIMHRNIHPRNIAFTDNGCMKVCNFRNARWLWDEDISIQADDVQYQGPELLMQTNICSTSIDIWSAGCILAELLLRKPLFESNGPRDTLRKVFSVFGFPTKECWPEFFTLPEFEMFYYDEKKTHSYNFLKLIFKRAKCSVNQSTMDLLQSMFCLDPKQRFTAIQCSSHNYFSEEPQAGMQDEVVHCVNIVLNRQAVERCYREKELNK